MPTEEQFIAQFGEVYRPLIHDVLKWLDEREPIWKLDEPIDREELLIDLISRANIKSNSHEPFFGTHIKEAIQAFKYLFGRK